MVFKYCSQRCLNCETDSVLTCGRGVDGNIRVFQQDNFGTNSTLPNSSAYSQEGVLFSMAEGVRPTRNPIIYTFENPANNTKTMYLVNVEGGARPSDDAIFSSVAVDIYIAGVKEVYKVLTPVNRNLGSSIVSTLHVSEADTFAGNSISATTHPSGEYSLDFYGNIIVPPGNTLAIRVVRDFPTDSDVLRTTITWFEI